MSCIIYKKLYNSCDCSSNIKDPTTTLASISSALSRPVLPTSRTGRPYRATPPVRPVPRTSQTGLRKTKRLHTQPSSAQLGNALTGRVSLHHFPPLCISADEFNAAGAETDVRVS